VQVVGRKRLGDKHSAGWHGRATFGPYRDRVAFCSPPEIEDSVSNEQPVLLTLYTLSCADMIHV